MLKDPRAGVIALVSAVVVGTVLTMFDFVEGLTLFLVVLTGVIAWKVAHQMLPPPHRENEYIIGLDEGEQIVVEYDDCINDDDDDDDEWVEVGAADVNKHF